MTEDLLFFWQTIEHHLLLGEALIFAKLFFLLGERKSKNK
jgi:hypothetical protein